MPSVREGWGIVVVEANSVGTPAVGYDVGGIRDSIRDGRTGLLATSGDPLALATQAISLVTDERRYEAMRSAAMDWAEGFSWERTAEELLGLVGHDLARPRRVQAGRVVAVRESRARS
jgi:glycosyltransferase involved in cell wall biosynthesis